MASAPPPAPDEQHALDRRWRIWAGAGIGAIAIIGFAIGFLALPAGQSSKPGFNLFAAMCRAIGVPVSTGASASRDSRAQPAAAPASGVTWTTDTRRLLANASISGGESIAAKTCAACHGKDGIAATPIYPNLAHQPAPALFKQLLDYKSRSRQGGQAAIMTAIAATLGKQQMVDVAAYYASRPSPARARVDSATPPQVSRLVSIGDPQRALPPCDACHGKSQSGPEGAPALRGQSTTYLEAQMNTFATGERGNDIFARMRTIARQLTPDERRDLAAYYGVTPSKKAAGLERNPMMRKSRKKPDKEVRAPMITIATRNVFPAERRSFRVSTSRQIDALVRASRRTHDLVPDGNSLPTVSCRCL